MLDGMSTPAPFDPDKSAFMERFADYWVQNGGSHFEGRICRRLLLNDAGGVSAAQLATELSISRGSISMAVRCPQLPPCRLTRP